MTRFNRLLFDALIIAALLLGFNSLVAVGSWVTSWRAYSSLAVSLSDVQLVDDDTRIDIGLIFINDSSTPLRIIAIQSGANLNGRYISGTNVRPDDSLIAPGARYEIQVQAPVPRTEQGYLAQQQVSGPLRWRIDGRVLVQAGDIGEPKWINYIDWLESP